MDVIFKETVVYGYGLIYKPIKPKKKIKLIN